MLFLGGRPAKMNKTLVIGSVTWFDYVIRQDVSILKTRLSTMSQTPVERANALESDLTVARFTLPIIDSRWTLARFEVTRDEN